MRSRIAPLIVVLLALGASPAAAGQILLAIQDPTLLETRADRPLAADPALAGTLARHGLAARWVTPPAPGLDLTRRYLLLDGAADPRAAAAALRAVPGVAAAAVAGTRELFLVPNDPYFTTQWHLRGPAVEPASFDFPAAWDLEWGAADVVIAIIDTGVDWSHPDLAATAWTNAGETPGNGVDDDLNGRIDDVHGWDCGNNDADARPETYLEMGLDVGFHGSHCAGIAAAATNNAVGVAGAAPGCRVMPLKVNNAASQITDAAITAAFVYAITNGARVISMSFGGPDEGGAAAFYQDLVDQALAAGIACVAAAGNNNDPSLMYPAACAGVISVGATNQAGARASFSSYGAWVTVNAPGEHIWSTIQNNYEFDFLTGLLYQLTYGWDGVNPYMYCDGTSMACPLVAGVCGLVASRDPTLTPAEVRQLLIDTGEQVAYDQPLGVRVDPVAALLALETTAAPDLPAALAIAAAPNPFNPRTVVRFSLAEAGPATVEILDLRGLRVRTLAAGEVFPRGWSSVVWNGADEAGRPTPSGVYVGRVATADGTATVKLLLAR
ncbi:MAG TPA: S8 family serine peptidase [Candidatus Krumholzibacteria bacterium]|nr:S8 family serine peptidase [Candidatus Krumholzibacteria bacterium]HPD72397.1 S8 family serine peptidase [Candidatus Krumholzibacteria bacterium]HRY40671.1 S8 family serine peptidase [Candidatus Krumholzibacteria bacterium]